MRAQVLRAIYARKQGQTGRYPAVEGRLGGGFRLRFLGLVSSQLVYPLVTRRHLDPAFASYQCLDFYLIYRDGAVKVKFAGAGFWGGGEAEIFLMGWAVVAWGRTRTGARLSRGFELRCNFVPKNLSRPTLAATCRARPTCAIVWRPYFMVDRFSGGYRGHALFRLPHQRARSRYGD